MIHAKSVLQMIIVQYVAKLNRRQLNLFRGQMKICLKAFSTLNSSKPPFGAVYFFGDNMRHVIVIEGPDFSGKTTQVKNLVEMLDAKRIKVASYKFHNYSAGISGNRLDYLVKNWDVTQCLDALKDINDWNEKYAHAKTIFEQIVDYARLCYFNKLDCLNDVKKLLECPVICNDKHPEESVYLNCLVVDRFLLSEIVYDCGLFHEFFTCPYLQDVIHTQQFKDEVLSLSENTSDKLAAQKYIDWWYSHTRSNLKDCEYKYPPHNILLSNYATIKNRKLYKDVEYHYSMDAFYKPNNEELKLHKVYIRPSKAIKALRANATDRQIDAFDSATSLQKYTTGLFEKMGPHWADLVIDTDAIMESIGTTDPRDVKYVVTNAIINGLGIS